MSSVKNRILQFQQQQNEDTSTTHVPEFCTNGSITTNKKSIASTSSGNTSNSSLSSFSNSPKPITPQSKLTIETSLEPDPENTMSTTSTKKTLLNINLSSPSTNQPLSPTPGNAIKPQPSQNRPLGLSKPRSSSSSTNPCVTSSIPKLISPTGPAVIRSTPASPSSNGGLNAGKLYGAMDWKEKYEEAERKRLHIVSLAQKATRDYEELRRRYQELCSENEKVVQRLNSSTTQLDALRKASEAAYDDYYKLRKHYQAENSAKSLALSRVDEYNKENRRLKRQSAALMQHVNEGGSLDLEQLMEAESEGHAENDKEISFLRSRVQELESGLVDLESELERTRLAEFESQEAALLIKDSEQSSAKEIKALKQRLSESESENEKLNATVKELHLELESLKSKRSVDAEKLKFVEAELRKVQTEKTVLQRQSVVFFSHSTLDAQLQDALNQISDLQFQFEEQKLSYETQILELQDQIHERESKSEAEKIKVEAKLHSFESLVIDLRRRAEEAEKKLEELPEPAACVPAPPPPPPLPPMMMGSTPPAPPSSLNNAIQSVTLRRAKKEDGSPPTASPESKSIIPTSSPQIDDVVSEIKKGIKLRSAESRTLSRKETEVAEAKPADSIAIEEMRSILNNLKRTRRVN